MVMIDRATLEIRQEALNKQENFRIVIANVIYTGRNVLSGKEKSPGPPDLGDCPTLLQRTAFA